MKFSLEAFPLRSNSDTRERERAVVNRRSCYDRFLFLFDGYVTSPRIEDRNSRDAIFLHARTHMRSRLLGDSPGDEAGNLHRVPPRRHPFSHLSGGGRINDEERKGGAKMSERTIKEPWTGVTATSKLRYFQEDGLLLPREEERGNKYLTKSPGKLIPSSREGF